MAGPRKLRPGAIGIAITVYDVWRRLPPAQRQQVLNLARKHGPRAAAKVAEFQRTQRARRRGPS
jgi:hypothetical protein